MNDPDPADTEQLSQHPGPSDSTTPPLEAIGAALELIENLVDTYLELAQAGAASHRAAVEEVLAESPPPSALNEALALIDSLRDRDPCRFDHHGGCQAHGYLDLEPGERCPNQHAAEFLTRHGHQAKEADQT